MPELPAYSANLRINEHGSSRNNSCSNKDGGIIQTQESIECKELYKWEHFRNYMLLGKAERVLHGNQFICGGEFDWLPSYVERCESLHLDPLWTLLTTNRMLFDNIITGDGCIPALRVRSLVPHSLRKRELIITFSAAITAGIAIFSVVV